MEGLKIYTEKDILNLVNHRAGETKLGAQVQFISSLEDLETSSAAFVLLGIPEDIGVRANYGIAGTSTAWYPALTAILNTQSNRFLSGTEVLVLGHFDLTMSEENTIEGLRLKVDQIDALVYPVIEQIIAAGKIPIVIGGGHNNAYPIIKGASIAKKKPLDVINIDAHADIRQTTGRHSGNGFSYAFKGGFLGRYGIFGLHQSYNNEATVVEAESNPNIYPVFFDEILSGIPSIDSFWQGLIEIFDQPGLEIDLDSIENILSSASTPSGFTVNEIRKLILMFEKKYAYLHICEGAVAMSDGRQSLTSSKVIAYLVTDFIKSQNK